MPVSHLRRVTFRSTIGGTVKIANTFHITDPSGADTVTRIQALATAIGTTGAGTLMAAYAGMLDSASKVDEVHVSQVPLPATPHEPVLASSFFPNLTGTAGAVTVNAPREMCIVITLQTGLAGRRFRGRLFLPPRGNQATQRGELWGTGSSHWTNAAAFVTALAKLQANSGAHYSGDLSATDLVVYSKVQTASDPTGSTGTPVLAIRQNQPIHWLSSRGK